ncbi:MAG: hypothetical protein J3K34DRAFT_415917 [Monoraphidium minutum]|nr:MAG: hypothetical protein J3K34DRAFT_415917 [Monoraphidium minutum]
MSRSSATPYQPRVYPRLHMLSGSLFPPTPNSPRRSSGLSGPTPRRRGTRATIMLGQTSTMRAAAARCGAARPRAFASTPHARRHVCARSVPVPDADILTRSDSEKVDKMMECFKMADLDGNGQIDKQELRMLLESVEGGLAYLMAYEGMLPEAKLDAIFDKYDADKSGTITFDEFQAIVLDGLLLEGTFGDYERAFRAVDDSKNGSIGATELAEMFRQLGNPMSADKLADVFMKYDVDGSGQIDFPEFVEMFRDSVLDLAAINAWVTEREGGEAVRESLEQDMGLLETVDGTVSLIFSEAELDEVIQKHAARLVIMFAGVTWCRPCKGVQKPYERMADFYDSAVFLKLYGNANVQTKKLFQRLKIRSTPAYLLFRGGELVGQGSGANKERLEELIRSHLKPEELAGKEPLYMPASASA